MNAHHQTHSKQFLLRLYGVVTWFMRFVFNRLIALALMVITGCSLAWAQNSTPPAIDITDQFSERKISRDIAVFEDVSGQLTFDQIRTQEIDAQFVPSSKDSPSFGFTNSAYWARFSLNHGRTEQASNLSEPLYLLLAYAQTDLAELWCTNSANKTIVEQRAGDHVPRVEWPSSFREPAFKITPDAQHCWLRIQTSSSLQMPLTLYSEDAFFKMHLSDNALQALYFGALLVMLVYNGIIAVSIRSRAYTSYALFLLSYGLFQCSFGGLGYQMLWTDQIGLADTLTPFLVACVGVSSCIFVQIFLDLKTRAPRFYKLGWWVGWLFFVNLIVAWVLPYAYGIKAVMLGTPIWAIFLVGAGIYLARRGDRSAQIYLAAWFAFILGTLTIVFSRIGFLPINAFTANASQIGSAIEFIMLSFALAERIKTTQAALLAAQTKVTETLQASEQSLNEKVELRTAELKAANFQTNMTLRLAESAKERAIAAQRQAEQERKEAELAREQTAHALAELQESQTKLVVAEKMASLGLLVSNVAHEINTPNSAVQSSSITVADSMRATLQNMPRLLESVSSENLVLFLQLISNFDENNETLSTREERQITKQVTSFLENAGIDGGIRKARLVVKLRAHAQLANYLPLLNSPDGDFILSAATGVVDVLNGTSNIQNASAKISRIVGSLKELSGNDRSLSMFENHLYQCMERTIKALESKFQDIEVVRNYQDMAPLRCDPESMEQSFSHLLVNAAQAMEHRGTLMIGMRTVNNHAEIRITDFGFGIADEIKDRIFEPFFTTRTSGEGGGMGLALVKKVVDQHKGHIEVQTEVGMGTTITITLPYENTQAR